MLAILIELGSERIVTVIMVWIFAMVIWPVANSPVTLLVVPRAFSAFPAPRFPVCCAFLSTSAA